MEREQGSDKELLTRLDAALEEVIGLAYLMLQMGNFLKLEGLVTAARFLVDALGDRVSSQTRNNLGKLEAILKERERNQGWMI